MVDTPLFEKPLEGSRLFAFGPGKQSGLPDIVAALKGQIDIDLDGKIETVGGRLRTSFKTVPDAPVSKFTLSLDGGPERASCKTAPTSARPRCASTSRWPARTGKAVEENPLLGTPCGGKGRQQGKRRAGANRGGGR